VAQVYHDPASPVATGYTVLRSFCIGGSVGDLYEGDTVDLDAATACPLILQGRLAPVV
jgi:hypothetical protein